MQSNAILYIVYAAKVPPYLMLIQETPTFSSQYIYGYLQTAYRVLYMVPSFASISNSEWTGWNLK